MSYVVDILQQNWENAYTTHHRIDTP